MIIVADSSALVALALWNGLQWLDYLFDKVIVPQTVFNEVAIVGKPQSNTLREYLIGKSASVDHSNFVLTSCELGQGELEAMALYKLLKADYLLIDDQRARKVAQLNQIKLTGSQGVLLLAKHHGLISKVKPYLRNLHRSKIYISDSLICKILHLAGESQLQ